MDKDRIHQLSDALTVSERRRQETQRLSGVGFWELDHQNESLYWSEEIFNIYELDSDTVKPNYEVFLSLIYDEDRDLVHKTYQDSVKFKTEYCLRYRHQSSRFDQMDRGKKYHSLQWAGERSSDYRDCPRYY